MSPVITEPSICIPRTINNVKWFDVKATIEKLLGQGSVERIDIVRRKDDDSPMCRIFIHMRYWNVHDPKIKAWRDKLLEPDGEVRVVYNHPWFWKCKASRIDKPEKKRIAAAPYIMANDVTKTTTNTLEEHIERSKLTPRNSDVETQASSD